MTIPKKMCLFFITLICCFASYNVAGNPASASTKNAFHAVTGLSNFDLVQKIEEYLRKKVPGLNASYHDVFDAIVREGYDIYVKGGLIRDLLQENGAQPIDLDFSYSCTADELESILIRNHWMFTRLPQSDFVDIGDRSGLYLEGTPICWTLVENEYKLDFTVNNILYYYNAKCFIDHSDEGIKDVKNRKLNIIAKDWKKWLYGGDPDEKNGGKIFRFWKMVAKGYIYTAEFEELIYNEAIHRQKADPEAFKEEVIAYLAYHPRSINEIINGARIIMGNEWVEASIKPFEEAIIEKSLLFERDMDEYTFFKEDQ